jgi:DNA-binding Xre family transcriptional regulator
MNAKIETTRKKEQKVLAKEAAKITAILEATGIKQGILAKRIGVSQNTLSRFMAGDEDYVTKRLVPRIKEYCDENFSSVKVTQ